MNRANQNRRSAQAWRIAFILLGVLVLCSCRSDGSRQSFDPVPRRAECPPRKDGLVRRQTSLRCRLRPRVVPTAYAEPLPPTAARCRSDTTLSRDAGRRALHHGNAGHGRRRAAALPRRRSLDSARHRSALARGRVPPRRRRQSAGRGRGQERRRDRPADGRHRRQVHEPGRCRPTSSPATRSIFTARGSAPCGRWSTWKSISSGSGRPAWPSR